MKKLPWKTILIGLSIVGILYLIYRLGRKVMDSAAIRPEFLSFSFKKDLITLAKIAVSGMDAKISFDLKNFSDSKFTVNKAYLEIYSKDGVLIAQPSNPSNKTIIVNPNSSNPVVFDYWISKTGIIDLLKGSGMSYSSSSLAQLAQKAFLEGKFGFEMQLKGYIMAEGIPYQIPINQTIVA